MLWGICPFLSCRLVVNSAGVCTREPLLLAHGSDASIQSFCLAWAPAIRLVFSIVGACKPSIMHGPQQKREEAGLCFLEPECWTPDPSQAAMPSRWSCWLAAQSNLINLFHSLVIRCGGEASSPPQTVWIQAGQTRHDRTETPLCILGPLLQDGVEWTPSHSLDLKSPV